jgi:Tfp pilus assembly protein PilP
MTLRHIARRTGLLLACAGLAGTVLACSGDDEGETTTVRGSGRPLRAKLPTKPKKPGDAKTPGKPGTDDLSITEVGPFTYKPGRDPFQSYFDITGPETAQTTPLEPLQKHDLSKFRLTAIVSGTVAPVAVVLDPNGKTFLVKRGTLIGPPRGRVAQILSDRVVVEREFKDRLERVHKLKSELRLRLDEGETKQ